jgi:protease-4
LSIRAASARAILRRVRRWWSILVKQFLITVAGVLVGLILFLIIGPMVLIGSLSSQADKRTDALPAAIVLGLDLREDMTDTPARNPFGFSGGASVVETVRTLESAAKDNRVKGVFIRANTMGMAPAHAEEIRAALATFRANSGGKFIHAHIQNDGIRTSLAGYSAVAGADKIWLHDASEMLPMGLVAEETFFGDTLKRFRMEAQFETREEFKTAADALTQNRFTPANRESTDSLLEGLYTQMIAHIAEDRKAKGLTPQAVRDAIEATPYSGEVAKEKLLVDELGRPEDAMDEAIKAGGGKGKARIIDINDYTPKAPSGPVIALVVGEGAIVSGLQSDSLFGDEQTMNGDEIAEALREAADDDNVRAIVFRVSSPGGSVVASDQIWHAVEYAKKKKQVVVSMGAYAASGGYYVSAGANEIVANPMTITGSIGVVGGKVIVGKAMEHYLSARTDYVQRGSDVADYFSGARGFDQKERAAFSDFISRAYDDFLQLVATGRGMTPDQVRDVAKGRVWTGVQAHERKLVNTLGGLSVAVGRAKALAQIAETSSVSLRVYPKEPSPFQAFEDLFGATAEQARAAALLGALAGDERLNALIREATAQNDIVRAEARVNVK